MAHFRRLLVAVLGAVSLVGAASAGVGAHDGGTLVEFESMTGVSPTGVNLVNDRGISRTPRIAVSSNLLLFL